MECEDELLKTTENLLDYKIVTCKNNCLIDNILVITGTLLLADFAIRYYYYYTRNWKKWEHLIPFSATIIKLRKIRY